MRSTSPTAVTLKEGAQIEFKIDQAVDLARPMVGIELAVKPLPVGRFGCPGGLQKTTEERLLVVVNSSTLSIPVTSCRTHGLKSIGENANSSQPAGGHFSLHPSLQLGEISLRRGGRTFPTLRRGGRGGARHGACKAFENRSSPRKPHGFSRSGGAISGGFSPCYFEKNKHSLLVRSIRDRVGPSAKDTPKGSPGLTPAVRTRREALRSTAGSATAWLGPL